MLRRAFLVSVLLALFVAPAALGRSLVIERFDVTVTVGRDGSIAVTETIKPRFEGSWNGIYRTIPVEYRTPQGFNYTLLLDLESVTDEKGQALKVESSRERHYRKFKIWVPGAQDATRTVILQYRVKNGLKFFEEHDELYWNVTGDEWEVPIEAAAARIFLPEGATGVRALAFTGAYGSTAHEAHVDVRTNVVDIGMWRKLSFHEGLTAVVGWDKGFVAAPGVVEKAWRFLSSNWPLGFPILVFGLMYRVWYTRGRDPRLRPISPRYEPPEDLTPAEAGVLIDNTIDMRDVTATLVDLAVRGYFDIEEKREDRMLGLWRNEDYIFHLRKEDKEELKAHESELLESLFLGEKHVRLSELENRFYAYLPGICDQIFEALMRRGCYVARPDRVKKRWRTIGLVVVLVSIWGLTVVAEPLGISWVTALVAGLLSAAVILGFSFVMPARTAYGARALEQVLGFQEFLARVEADRLERMVRSPELFDKYLPYAMAFGVEKNWARAFEGISSQPSNPPRWYRGTDLRSFDALRLTSNVSRLGSLASTAMTSRPRSSGGSGFGGSSWGGEGGGGHSGGGFGGGGGGGF